MGGIRIRNLTIGYIVFLGTLITIWWMIIPSQEKLLEQRADEKFRLVLRSLEVQISSRYGLVDQWGNLSTRFYRYPNVTITDWELSENNSRVTMFFDIISLVRVKEWQQVIDEYLEPSVSRSMEANLEGDFWVLDVNSAKIIDNLGPR
jgi:hypothetical protein